MRNQILLIAIFAVLLSLANVSAVAQCVNYGTVDFGTASSYGVNQDIVLKPEISSLKSLVGYSARVRLLQKNIFDNNYQVINQRLNLNILTDNSLQEITFQGVTRKEPIKFELTIFDTTLSNGEITFTSDAINVKDALTITPSISPQVQNAGQDIVITLTIKDASGNLVTTPLTIIPTIQCGTTFVNPTLVSNTEIRFRTTAVGFCLATISAESAQYIGDEQSITFELITAGISQKIKVGGVPYENLDAGKISTGSKAISLGFTEGNIPVKLDVINARIQRPDSGFDALTFTPSNSEKTEWSITYNFLSSDRTYSMTGTADNFQTSKQYTISVIFNTVGGGDLCDIDPTNPECVGGGIPFWVWIVAGIIILVIVVGVIIVVRRK